jgi:hypothetical protein
MILQLPLTEKNKFVTKMFKNPRTWKDSVNKQPKRKKMDMRFCTWNVGGSLRAVVKRQNKRKKTDLINALPGNSSVNTV